MKLKILQTCQKHLSAMGFIPNQQQNNHRQLNSVHIFTVAVYSINIICMSSYIFFVANDIDEYMDSILALTAVVCITIALISLIPINDQLFINIELCANELNNRK